MPTKSIRGRKEIRDSNWPGAARYIYIPKRAKGFSQVPRLLPWITTLIRELAHQLPHRGDPSSVYVDLWCRYMGEGIIEIKDEVDAAFAAGYTGTRAMRTWYEHVDTLVELRFIDIRKVGNRRAGHVLLLDPLAIARWYHEAGKTSEGWWASLESRAREVEARLPPAIDFEALLVKPVPVDDEDDDE